MHDELEHDFTAVIGEGSANSTIPAADRLVRYAEACVEGNRYAVGRSRAALAAEIGDGAVVDAAAVIAVFNAAVRIADATGMPLEPFKAQATADLRSALDIERYCSS